MLCDDIFDLQAISASKKLLSGARPHIKEIIDFYEDLFIIQKAGAKTIQNPPVRPEDLGKELPLASRTDFRIDLEGSESIFLKVMELCIKEGINLSQSAKKLGEHMKENGISYAVLGQHWMEGTAAEIVPGKAGVLPEHLEFILYNSLKPAIIGFSKQIEKHLGQTDHLRQTACPVCGSTPGFSILSENGGRSLVCGFCWYEWKTVRIFCPFCANTDPDTLEYMVIEEEKEVRADLCNKCGEYIKTIDLRAMDPSIYPPMALVSSVSLDIIADGTESAMTG